jgi:hypothetical protein
MVGASFTVAAVAQVLRSKKGITAVGNAQIDTAQSKFGGASALFDGTGDYLQIVDSSLKLGTSNFTIEGWVYPTVNPGNDGVFHLNTSILGSNTNGLAVGMVNDNGNGNSWTIYSAGTGTKSGGATISTNTWYHFALVRNGSALNLYVNGTSIISITDSTDYSTQDSLAIGGHYSSNYVMQGNLDEFRISNSARYTTNFTPSTTPFVNDANTLLLIHADGTDASTFFEDDNGVRGQKGITAIGTAQVDTAQSKFGGASLLLDGTGDALSTAGIAFGTGNFTVEYWIRPTTLSGYDIHWDLRGTPSSNLSPIVYTLDGTLIMDVGASTVITGSVLSTNTWYHIALARSGSSTKLFVNGTQVGSTYTDTNNYISAATLYIGELYSLGGLGVVGNMDEFRISNSARYTANFTAPTAPFVNDANTVLLIHADGTDASTVFRDDNGARNQVGLFSTGGALISTTQSKFGGSSMYFDGTNDLVRSGVYNSLALNSGNWTIEGWIHTSDDLCELINYQDFPTNNGWAFGLRSSGRLLFVSSNGGSSLNVILSSNNAYTNNTWTHFAVVYNSGTITLYSNGTNVGSSSWVSPDFASVDGLRIGAGYGNSSGLFQEGLYYYVGYLDEVRISNTARYTANFTAPTAQFQNDANTVLLLHGDGTNNSTVFVDDNGIAPYTP